MIDVQPAAFLDRDGVINIDDGYSFRPEFLQLTRTAGRGIRLLNKAGYLVIVVTNQSGVARGLYGEDDVHRCHARIVELLAAEGARIDAFYYAPYHPDGIITPFAIEHDDRKPGAGMIRAAMRDWPIRHAGSFLIGDRDSDAEAAARAGLPALLIPRNDGDLLAAVRQMLDRVHPGSPKQAGHPGWPNVDP